MSMSKTLGAFYICFKERTAIEKSIASFKNFYPDAPLYLTSDGYTIKLVLLLSLT